MKPTKQQEQAINTNAPLLVSAAAGSGKTAVLTERVIKKITDKENSIPADRLLIVTFTNAAANEMRSRIEKRLSEECAKKPNEISLIRQKHLLANADICTIDSFCINLVRENFEDCLVEPDFSVSDGSEMNGICSELLNNIIDNHIETEPEITLKLMEITSCEYDYSELKGIVESLYLYSMQMPFPDAFLDNLVFVYEKEFGKSHPFYGEIVAILDDYILESINHIENMKRLSEEFSVDFEKTNEYVKTLFFMFDSLRKKIKNKDYDEIREEISELSLGKIAVSSKNGEAGAEFKEERNCLNNILSKIFSLFAVSSSELNNDNKDLFSAVALLVKIVKEYGIAVFNAFCEENKLAFYHTEQLALRLLCEYENGSVKIRPQADFYLSKYDEVMVDEFQDVNDLQNMLFYCLSKRDEKLFVVGDIKQSIYRFRGSNLLNFLNKKKTFIPIENAKSDEPKKIILSDNFRSRKGICNFANFLFKKIMTENTGDLIYNEEEMLNSSGDFPETGESEVELLLVENNDENENSLFELEAQKVAIYIENLVKNKTKLKGKDGSIRNAEYGDICILLDKMSNKSPVLIKALKERNIPVVSANESFCDSPEISLALNLLTVLDNPAKDIELLSVMMSPLFGFSPDEMANLRVQNKKESIYNSLLKAEENGNQKVKDFLDTLSKFRNEMAILPLQKFIFKLIYQTNLLAIVSAMKSPKQRIDNLLLLPNFAKNFSDKSPSEFVEYLKGLPESSFNHSEAKNGNVRIMSMHKSKGLQFPICILCDLSSRINNSDSISKIVFSDKSGIGFKYYDEKKEVYVENLARKIISHNTFKENLSEKMRLLYVAMTRAEEKLVMVTSLSNAEKTLKRISMSIENGGINPFFVKSVSSISDWLLASVLTHKNGKILRDTYGINKGISASNGEINIIFASKLTENNDYSDNEVKVLENREIADKIKSNFSYTYPFEELSQIEAKTSVSRIAKDAESDKYLFAQRPSFMNEKGMSSSQKGTAVHSIMQFIRFDENVDVNAEISRLVEWQYITKEQGECADIQKITAFFASNLYKRIIKSSMIKREMRFLTELDAKEIKEDVSDIFKNEKVIVQGAVDLLFEEDDGIVVVDFKTDRVDNQEPLIEAYSSQLEIYAKACERIFGKRVKEMIIYSFELSKEISLTA